MKHVIVKAQKDVGGLEGGVTNILSMAVLEMSSRIICARQECLSMQHFLVLMSHWLIKDPTQTIMMAYFYCSGTNTHRKSPS